MSARLNPGYKQTEVGVIPEEWEVKTLGALTNQIIDGTHHTPRYRESGVPFLRVTDIQESEINFAELKFISRAEHDMLRRRCNPEKGDLLLSKNGTIGIPKIVSWDWEFSIFVSLALLKLRHQLISVKFLEQFFMSDFLTTQIRQRSKQGTVTNLHLEEIREFRIPVPAAKTEQDAIAGALSDVDALIGSLTQLIAKKRDLKQAAMQQLLSGKLRLPGFRGATSGYKQTEVGVIPEDWAVKTLGSLTSLLTNGFVGTATSAYVDNDDGVLYLQGYNIHENGFNFHGIKRVSKSFHARNQKSCLQPGDLLTVQTGDIGVTAVVPPELAGANCHALVISRLDERVSEPFFYCQYFNSERGRVAFKEIETGSTMKHLNVGDMKRLFLPAPRVEEQTAIAEVLSDMDAEFAALDQRLAKTRALKQGMMQELLTGRIRLV